MTRSELPPESAVPDPAVRELQALYREAASEEPGSALDRRILDAARAELQARPAKRPSPWWRGWLPLTSAIAVAAVGLSLTWRVMDQQERELREEMNAAGAADARPGKSAPAEAPIAAKKPALDVPVPKSAPARGAEAEATRESSPAAPSAEPQAGKLEAKRFGSGGESAADAVAGTAARSAAQAADAATPEAWLKQIRDLRAVGRSAEAAQSLARFRARYPDIVLPDDLRDLK